MTISDLQRRQTEDRIRAATDRLLRGQIPPGGSCDIKTLAREAGVSRASLYRTYYHLKQEFEDRLARLRDAGHLPDPRAAQILRLTDDNTKLHQRLNSQDQQLAELTTLKTTALSRLAAQHTEIVQLRTAMSDTGNLITLRRPRRGPDQATTTTTSRTAPGPTLDASGAFAQVAVHAGVLAATADLLELMHDFLDEAGPALRTDLGRFVASRETGTATAPAIEAAILVNELMEATDLLPALADQPAGPTDTEPAANTTAPAATSREN